MAHLVSKNQYEDIKNQKYVLVNFDFIGRRTMHYSGLSIIGIMEAMQKQVSLSVVSTVFTEEEIKMFNIDLTKRDIEYFRKFKQDIEKLKRVSNQ
jgi:hypothetical protein